MRPLFVVLLAAFPLLVAGCTSDTGEPGADDGVTPGATDADAGAPEEGTPVEGASDAGSPDAGAPDGASNGSSNMTMPPDELPPATPPVGTVCTQSGNLVTETQNVNQGYTGEATFTLDGPCALELSTELRMYIGESFTITVEGPPGVVYSFERGVSVEIPGVTVTAGDTTSTERAENLPAGDYVVRIATSHVADFTFKVDVAA